MIYSTEGYDMSNEQIKIEITQDKLVDILLHSATREDINKLDMKISDVRNELKEDINKLDVKISDLRTELKEDINKLDVKISDLRTELKEDISGLRTELKEVRTGQTKILWGVFLAVVVPILLHFLHIG